MEKLVCIGTKMILSGTLNGGPDLDDEYRIQFKRKMTGKDRYHGEIRIF